MHFDSWQAFWDMGGYGLYVWLAFGMSLLALLVLCIDSFLAKHSLLAKVQSEVARKQRIQIARTAQIAGSQQSQEIEVERVNES
jgi:heme exporter protein D